MLGQSPESGPTQVPQKGKSQGTANGEILRETASSGKLKLPNTHFHTQIEKKHVGSGVLQGKVNVREHQVIAWERNRNHQKEHRTYSYYVRVVLSEALSKTKVQLFDCSKLIVNFHNQRYCLAWWSHMKDQEVLRLHYFSVKGFNVMKLNF